MKLYLPPILWMIFIFILSSIPNLELQGEFSVYDFFLRKLAHIAEYAILFLLWERALGNWKKAFIISFAYAIADEMHQYFVPTRDGKAMDVLVDGTGIVLGWFLLKLKTIDLQN
ncbi:MAG: VanZ family protein [Candidatus Cloacimonetes bacterium]|nr:VanZ family protein [Candidatus Cloacimonadota bacterium]